MNDDGYLLIQNFLSEKDHNHFLDVCDDVLNRVFEDPDHPHFSWNKPGCLNKVHGACSYEREFLRLASHPTLVNKAKEILDTDEELDVYISKFFPMMPDGGISTLMHQDNFYFRGKSEDMVSCAVYLQDTNKENGCLRIAKQSHLNGIVPHDTLSAHDPGINWINPKYVQDNYEVVDFELPAPYAVFFDINSIHGCYTNKSENTRYSLAWEYVARSNYNVTSQKHVAFDRSGVIQYDRLD